MTDRNAPCSERIAEHLKSRLEDAAAFNVLIYSHGTEQEPIRAALDHLDLDIHLEEDDPDDGFALDEVQEAAMERHSEYPLAIEVKRVVIVQLSTGGPGDWFEVLLDSEGGVDNITYHFNDWFDHAQTDLQGDQFEQAENFLRPYLDLLEA